MSDSHPVNSDHHLTDAQAKVLENDPPALDHAELALTSNPLPVVALTGGMASGKSQVARYFSQLKHVVVVNCDEINHSILKPGQPAYWQVVEEFGRGVLEEGLEGVAEDADLNANLAPIDRSKLRALVFPQAQASQDKDINDKNKVKNNQEPSVSAKSPALQKLEAITHAAILAESKRRFAQAQANPAVCYVIWEVPLLSETGWQVHADAVISVICPLETKLERALARNPKLTRAQAQAMLAKQATDEQRLAISDYVVVNDASVSLEQLAQKVVQLDQELIQRFCTH